MKIKILISSLVLACISLTAFSLANWNRDIYNGSDFPGCLKVTTEDMLASPQIGPENNYVDFFYDLSTRFSPITKGELDKITMVDEFLEDDVKDNIHSYQSVSISIVINDERSQIRQDGTSPELTADQLNFLRSFDYSTNFVVQVNFMEKLGTSGKLISDYRSPHLTVVPEKMAYYEPGKQEMINYLNANNKENTLGLDEERLQAAKLYFIVTSKGEIENIELDRSSGYSYIDEAMIELLKNAPGRWVPGQNIEGQNVDQEMVISFGQIGC